MLNPCFHLRSPRTPSMQHAARSFVFHRALFGPGAARFLSISSRLGFFSVCGVRHFSNQCSDDDPGVASEDGDSEEDTGVWAVYDPLSGSVVTKAVGHNASGRVVGGGRNEEASRPNRLARNVEVSRPKAAGSPVSQGWGPVTKRMAGKTKMSWVCEDCGAVSGQWWGTCRSCNAMNTMKRFTETENSGNSTGLRLSEKARRSWLPEGRGEVLPQRLVDVNKGVNLSEWRLPLSGHFGMEVARLLGGGIVPGSLVLVGGDPGVGKSTLLLQIAAILSGGHTAKDSNRVIYISGEESVEQIANRAGRMRITAPELYLYSSTDIEDILKKAQKLCPLALVIDSIQTVYVKGISGSAGNIIQVKECTTALLRFAKDTNIPVLLIGHVTKSGDIAGPRMLEHIVDVVLYMEGERYSSYRLLRSVKNRFGSTDELGIFEMTQSGLQAVLNPSEMFLSDSQSDSEVLAGLAVAVVVDGSRTFLLEIQALCVSNSTSFRQINGIQATRADMIISVLIKQAGLKLQDNTVFLNVISGYKLTETAGDLAVAAAICSSYLEFPIPNNVAFIGEIGLGGELRMVPRMDKRIIALAKLGYKKCVIPKSAEKIADALDLDIMIVSCRNIKEVINSVFQTD